MTTLVSDGNVSVSRGPVLPTNAVWASAALQNYSTVMAAPDTNVLLMSWWKRSTVKLQRTPRSDTLLARSITFQPARAPSSQAFTVT